MSYGISFTDYSNKLINGKPAIWLQGYGWAEAKPAEDFKPGEYMRWNYGSCSKVEKIVSQTTKMMTFQVSWEGFSGKTDFGERKMKKDRWVAIGEKY